MKSDEMLKKMSRFATVESFAIDHIRSISTIIHSQQDPLKQR